MLVFVGIGFDRHELSVTHWNERNSIDL
jgi:hypothetical protein